jgi:hypothetical protein
MTLGTAASNSTSNAAPSDKRRGASSARKIDTPTPHGTAIKSAVAEVTSVP